MSYSNTGIALPTVDDDARANRGCPAPKKFTTESNANGVVVPSPSMPVFVKARDEPTTADDVVERSRMSPEARELYESMVADDEPTTKSGVVTAVPATGLMESWANGVVVPMPTLPLAVARTV